MSNFKHADTKLFYHQNTIFALKQGWPFFLFSVSLANDHDIYEYICVFLQER